MARLKRLEVRKSIVESVGKFDLAIRGLGPSVRKAHSMGEVPWGSVDPGMKDLAFGNPLGEVHLNKISGKYTDCNSIRDNNFSISTSFFEPLRKKYVGQNEESVIQAEGLEVVGDGEDDGSLTEAISDSCLVKENGRLQKIFFRTLLRSCGRKRQLSVLRVKITMGST